MRSLNYSEFGLAVPTRPGLGIELDEDPLDRFRRDRRVLAASVMRRQPLRNIRVLGVAATGAARYSLESPLFPFMTIEVMPLPIRLVDP